MLEIRNRSPFPVGVFPGRDREGYDDATVVVKGTFDLRSRRPEPALAQEQVPLVHGDEFFGNPPSSSIRYESDASPLKKGTDVVLVGHAYTGARAAPVVDVTLTAGPVRKTVRVFGDRTWQRALSGHAMTDPVPFAKMPLTYERAFGGSDTSDPDPAKHACEPRNPVGRGFIAGQATAVEGRPLPNLEDPRSFLSAPGDVPPPAGFGFIGRSWMPRVGFAGTYDERWRAERCPLLPADFDDRFHSGAHPDLIAPRHFRGGEPVVVTNASQGGETRFAVPTRALSVEVKIRGDTTARPLLLDTLLIEPDEGRVVVVWRTTFRCPRTFLFIDHLTIREATA